MTVSKLEDRLLETNITAQWFAEAMKELDLSRVPMHHRKNAVHEHLLKIMAHTVEDPAAKKALESAVESMELRKSMLL